jgi:hypothetical protein
MSNVRPIPTTTDPKITLDIVVQSMQEWRANKSVHQQTSIPDSLWRDIFALSPSHSPKQVRQLLSVSKAQYNRKFAQLFPSEKRAVNQEAMPVDFCEVNQAPSAVKHTPRQEELPRYMPVNTVIIELCRADGKIMKIHATSHCFREIIDAFYTGATHVANHA